MLTDVFVGWLEGVVQKKTWAESFYAILTGYLGLASYPCLSPAKQPEKGVPSVLPLFL